MSDSTRATNALNLAKQKLAELKPGNDQEKAFLEANIADLEERSAKYKA